MPPRAYLMATTKLSSTELEALADVAKDAAAHAYAPYSKFKVGAAVYARRPQRKGDAGTASAVFSGCNIENANYSLTLHAEHAAIAKAIELGYTELLAIVIYTPTTESTAPCGSCRQVIYEFSRDCVIIATNDGPIAPRWNISKLLPHAFGPDNLEK